MLYLKKQLSTLSEDAIEYLKQLVLDYVNYDIESESFYTIMKDNYSNLFYRIDKELYRGLCIHTNKYVKTLYKYNYGSFTTCDVVAGDFIEKNIDEDNEYNYGVLMKIKTGYGINMLNLVRVLDLESTYEIPECIYDEDEYFMTYEDFELVHVENLNDVDDG